MSLRVRLIVSILAVLLLSLAVGGLTAGWTATQSVRVEMQAALAAGERAVRSEANGGPATGRPLAEFAALVRLFDGNRHLRTALVDAEGAILVASTPLTPRRPAPAWLVRLLAPSLPSVAVPIAAGPPGGEVVLRAEPASEVAEVWGQVRDSVAVLALFCLLSAALVSLVVRRALQPLEEFSRALTALGAGSFAVRLCPAGSPELRHLAEGFNAMAERLGTAELLSRHLHEQLATIQEEERAELARDLHDEVGPFLFCVSVDAAAIARAAGSGQHDEILSSVAGIRQAVAHMQEQVRSMLGRLRPASPVELGLAASLRNLVAFWQARKTGIDLALRVTVAEDDLDAATKEVVYRVVQESLTNAVRHGQPGCIQVSVSPGRAGEVVAQVSDDGIGLGGAEALGFGLTGLRDRVLAKGGSFEVVGGPAGRGLTVTARLPYSDASDAALAAAAA
ncbi:histidine kinase [Paracraurococcus lichenis]|uniref:Histidine kinase n=1 Tax=Paracraurococcus lichenis TaxID=3064888 RepID=A0ABT9EBD3_9PROT|nr:histidine kinase [Paracraurococcus sp. LOR1-02]MDO9713511.1 histidine kinase [Paracraurococcus sp. LOR1-02]